MPDFVGIVILLAVALFILRIFSSGDSASRPNAPQPRRAAPIGRHPVSQQKARRDRTSSPEPLLTRGFRAVAAMQVDQVRSMFPSLGPDEIRDDLSRTGSVDATIDNILAGRVVVRSAMGLNRSRGLNVLHTVSCSLANLLLARQRPRRRN